MRILVLSDSHGSRRKVEAAAAEQPEAEVILHLGDGVDDSEDLTYLYPEKTIVRVRGNCDRYSDLPIEATVTGNGKTILLTHGHEFRVKYTPEPLFDHAQAIGAAIVLFGHTHRPETGYHDGLYWMNPGALKDNCYGIIDITEQRIVTNLMELHTR